MGGRLSPLSSPLVQPLSQLVGLREQIKPIEQNTRLFLDGCEANHALLTGARGCGKSSVVRGIFGKYRRRGLRLIETDAAGLAALPLLQPLLSSRAEKYVLYCDDFSFNDDDQIFRRLKSAIDGALSAPGGNVVIYATSNRRNIIAEKYADNLSPITDDGDIQPLETVDDKIALADRFGLWVPFAPPSQDEYDAIVRHWLKRMGVALTPALVLEARHFADFRGSRNGRIARQFAVIAAGRRGRH